MEHYDVDDFEYEEWSRPDEMAIYLGVWQEARRHLDSCPEAHVMDLCCGSGLSLLGIVSHQHIQEITAVDISAKAINFARKRLASSGRIYWDVRDVLAVTARSASCDLIVAASAYHHIADPDKPRFLAMVQRLLSERGVAVFGENVLPPYSDHGDSYAASLKTFYSAVEDRARQVYPFLPDKILKLIWANVVVGENGIYEYKVSQSIFHDHLKEAGLAIVRQERVWPVGETDLPNCAGNFVLVTRREQLP